MSVGVLPVKTQIRKTIQDAFVDQQCTEVGRTIPRFIPKFWAGDFFP